MSVTIHHKAHDKSHAFLKSHPVGVLATVDPNGEPHAAAIYFTVDGQSNVSFLTKTGTKKADNLQHNNHAVLVVYDAESQTTVQVVGTVEEITDSGEANQLFAAVIRDSIEASGQGMPPISKLREGDYVAYRLTPAQIRMAVFSRPKTGNYEDLFHTTTPDA